MGKILELIGLIVDTIKYIQKAIAKKKLNDANEQATTEQDQRPLEDALGGSSGPSTRKYNGMFERDRKEKK